MTLNAIQTIESNGDYKLTKFKSNNFTTVQKQASIKVVRCNLSKARVAFLNQKIITLRWHFNLRSGLQQ